MKKTLVIFFVAMASFSTFAQGLKFGIQIAPQVSLNRVKDQVKNFDISKSGAGMSFNAGPVLDLYLMDNVALSSGIWFSSKRSAVTFANNLLGTAVTAEYLLQYVQVPVSIKMYVNEIAGKWHPYIQVGTTLELQVGEKTGNAIAEQIQLDTRQEFSKFYDMGLVLALGTEMKIFSSNSVFGAITYNRGFFNVMRKQFQQEAGKLTTGTGSSDLVEGDVLKFKNDAIGLMLGFKF